jgi:hypothetical protein
MKKKEKKSEREALESDVRSNINVEKSGLKKTKSNCLEHFTSDKIVSKRPLMTFDIRVYRYIDGSKIALKIRHYRMGQGTLPRNELLCQLFGELR